MIIAERSEKYAHRRKIECIEGKGSKGKKQISKSIILRIKGTLKALKIRKEEIEGVKGTLLF